MATRTNTPSALRKTYEHRNRNSNHSADSENARTHGNDLLEGNAVRVSKKSSAAHVYRIRFEFPDHVLHFVRTRAERARGDRWDPSSDLPDRDLRNLRRDGCIAVWNRGRIGF